MLILALDTTTSRGSCALLRDDCVIREAASDTSRPQAARLPGELAVLLEQEGVHLHELDAFAVGIGPGSFTGLRIGIAAMQALALAGARPLFGVSALDALAHVAYLTGSVRRVVTWVDAWRGEVYSAVYENSLAPVTPVVALPEELLRVLPTEPAFFTGDGAAVHRDAIRAALGARAHLSEPVAPLLAGAMASLAAQALRAGERPLPHAVRPLYVRRPDAELARDAVRSAGISVAERARD